MKKKIFALLMLALLITSCGNPNVGLSESNPNSDPSNESITESQDDPISETESEPESESESELESESESEEEVPTYTTVTKSSFSSTSGNLDDVISYKCYKGGGTTEPAVYDDVIRLYQGSHGGYITLTAKDGYTITSATVGSAMNTTVGYSVNGSNSVTNGGSLEADGKYTLNDLSCDEVSFYCLGTSKSTRLYVNYLSVTYLGATGGTIKPDVPPTSESESEKESETVIESESHNNDSTSTSEPPYTGPGWGGKQTSNAPSNYYNTCNQLTGNALKNELASFNQPKSKSYDWSRYEAADEAEKNPNYILCLYTRHLIKKSSHCGSYSWDTWNREHIWTQTAYPNSKTDNHNIFACEGQINNVRGNLKFGDVENSSSNRVSVHGHQTDCYKANSLFEPCDEAKGEVARSVMYGVIYYGYNLTSMITSIKLILQWNDQFPVSNREIYRNNTVYGLQGNRNPFVDHPEYASLIWG